MFSKDAPKQTESTRDNLSEEKMMEQTTQTLLKDYELYWNINNNNPDMQYKLVLNMLDAYRKFNEMSTTQAAPIKSTILPMAETVFHRLLKDKSADLTNIITFFEKLTLAYPDNDKFKTSFAQKLIKTKQFDTAISLFKKYSESNPEDLTFKRLFETINAESMLVTQKAVEAKQQAAIEQAKMKVDAKRQRKLAKKKEAAQQEKRRRTLFHEVKHGLLQIEKAITAEEAENAEEEQMQDLLANALPKIAKIKAQRAIEEQFEDDKLIKDLLERALPKIKQLKEQQELKEKTEITHDIALPKHTNTLYRLDHPKFKAQKKAQQPLELEIGNKPVMVVPRRCPPFTFNSSLSYEYALIPKNYGASYLLLLPKFKAEEKAQQPLEYKIGNRRPILVVPHDCPSFEVNSSLPYEYTLIPKGYGTSRLLLLPRVNNDANANQQSVATLPAPRREK